MTTQPQEDPTLSPEDIQSQAAAQVEAQEEAPPPVQPAPSPHMAASKGRAGVRCRRPTAHSSCCSASTAPGSALLGYLHARRRQRPRRRSRGALSVLPEHAATDAQSRHSQRGRAGQELCGREGLGRALRTRRESGCSRALEAPSARSFRGSCASSVGGRSRQRGWGTRRLGGLDAKSLSAMSCIAATDNPFPIPVDNSSTTAIMRATP